MTQKLDVSLTHLENSMICATSPQNTLSRRAFILATGLVPFTLFSSGRARATTGPAIVAYRSPGCSCCEVWVDRMRQAGFDISMQDDTNLSWRRKQAGVPDQIAGCHTALMENYIIEGHVPPEDVSRFLSERPQARGLAVAGMPMGSPGMDSGSEKEPYDVLIFMSDGSWKVYASH